nr:hypothetical protein [uncultured Pseudoxanthomonas sp.]
MSVFIRLAAAATWCGLLLFTAPGQIQAQGQAKSQVDPVTWGLYTRLAESARQGESGSEVRWRWSRPGKEGQELVQEYFAGPGKLMYAATITPGTTAGTLHMKSPALGGAWTGTVQPDGSVVYVGTGKMKMHFKALLASDDAYEERSVALRNGAVVSVAEPSGRYLIASGTAAAVAVTPTGTPGSQPSFKWLDAMVGQSFVGTSFEGGVYDLAVSREGDTLVMTTPNGRLVIRPTRLGTQFQVLEAFGGLINENAAAYITGSSGATTGDSLDSYRFDSLQPGMLVTYDFSGGYYRLSFRPTHTGGFTYHQEGGTRLFGKRRAVGDDAYDDLRFYEIATQKNIEYAHAAAAAKRSQREAERRADELYEAEMAVERQQRGAAWNKARAASEQALADSLARLNGTVASVEAQQAQYRAQQQAAKAEAASARRQAEIDNADAATQWQENQAAQYAARERAAEQQQRAAALTVTSTDAETALAASTGEAARKQVFGFCSGLTLGGFERDNEAVIYVSSIGPVDYAFGQPMEPLKQAYAAKVGVEGLIPDCIVSTDRAVLERKRQEAIDNRGYPKAKRVMTGL